MNELTIYFIHALLATTLALGPFAVAVYLDLTQNRETKQKNL